MLTWFYSNSILETGAILLAVGIILTTFTPLLVRHFFKITINENLAKGAEESFKLFISVTLLLLAFCLVRAQGDHRGTEDIVSREGTVILKLDRAFELFGGNNGEILRKNLRVYADLLVQEEWPLLRSGERGLETTGALRNLSQRVKQLDPETPGQQVARSEAIQSVNQLSDLREARIAASFLQLPVIYWYAISTSLIFLTIFGWLQTPFPKLLTYVGGVTCGLSVLLTILISTCGIFKGEGAVTAEPIIKAIKQMNTEKDGRS